MNPLMDSDIWTVKFCWRTLTHEWVNAYGGHTRTNKLGRSFLGITIYFVTAVAAVAVGYYSLVCLPPVNSLTTSDYFLC